MAKRIFKRISDNHKRNNLEAYENGLQRSMTGELGLTEDVHRSTFQRLAAPTARARTARSTLSTRLPSTRLAR